MKGKPRAESVVVKIDREMRIRNIFNFSALGLILLYVIIAAATLLVGLFNSSLDDDNVFEFTINILVWGGVAVLASVLILMVIKLATLRNE